jgi:Leucine-rich repeat (LRR) protein
MPLEGLNIQNLPVSDLSPLAGITTLRSLLLLGNQVSDLSPLAGLGPVGFAQASAPYPWPVASLTSSATRSGVMPKCL